MFRSIRMVAFSLIGLSLSAFGGTEQAKFLTETLPNGMFVTRQARTENGFELTSQFVNEPVQNVTGSRDKIQLYIATGTAKVTNYPGTCAALMNEFKNEFMEDWFYITWYNLSGMLCVPSASGISLNYTVYAEPSTEADLPKMVGFLKTHQDKIWLGNKIHFHQASILSDFYIRAGGRTEFGVPGVDLFDPNYTGRFNNLGERDQFKNIYPSINAKKGLEPLMKALAGLFGDDYVEGYKGLFLTKATTMALYIHSTFFFEDGTLFFNPFNNVQTGIFCEEIPNNPSGKCAQ